MENDPVFARRPGEDLPMEKMRELTFLRYTQTEEEVQSLIAVSHLLISSLHHCHHHRVKQLFRYDFLTKEDIMSDPFKTLILTDCLGMYDWALAHKFFLSKGVSESG